MCVSCFSLVNLFIGTGASANEPKMGGRKRKCLPIRVDRKLSPGWKVTWLAPPPHATQFSPASGNQREGPPIGEVPQLPARNIVKKVSLGDTTYKVIYIHTHIHTRIHACVHTHLHILEHIDKGKLNCLQNNMTNRSNCSSEC